MVSGNALVCASLFKMDASMSKGIMAAPMGINGKPGIKMFLAVLQCFKRRTWQRDDKFLSK